MGARRGSHPSFSGPVNFSIFLGLACAADAFRLLPPRGLQPTGTCLCICALVLSLLLVSGAVALSMRDGRGGHFENSSY